MEPLSPDTLAPAAARLYAQVAHLEVDGESEGWPWATLCAALMAPLEPLYALLNAGDTPYAVAFDPEALAMALQPLDAAGVLPVEFMRGMLAWLGQFIGVTDRRELDTLGMRLRLRETSGYNRGKPSAIEGAARQRLVGPDGTPDSATVYLTDRIGDNGYTLAIATLAAETPDPAATERDIAEQMPAGRVWEYTMITGGTWRVLRDVHSGWGDFATTATWGDVRADPAAV